MFVWKNPQDEGYILQFEERIFLLSEEEFRELDDWKKE